MASIDIPPGFSLDEEAQAKLLESVQGKPPVVFYHYPCHDGVFAALAAELLFRARGVRPRYVPHEVYRQLDLEALRLDPSSVAFLLDYSGPDGLPAALARHVSAVVVLDHHQTAAQQLAAAAPRLPANVHAHLDMRSSGAALALRFFDPPGLGEDLRRVFGWVEDADLFRWQQPGSREFHAGLCDLQLEFSALRNPGVFDQLLALDLGRVVERGREVLRRQEALIAEAVAGARRHQLGGAQGLTRGWGACLGCRASGELVRFRSALGNRLALRSRELGLAPVGVVAYAEPEMAGARTHIKVSLRGVDGFDTAAVSEAFGGGGHAAASSCIVPLAELEAWEAMAS